MDKEKYNLAVITRKVCYEQRHSRINRMADGKIVITYLEYLPARRNINGYKYDNFTHDCVSNCSRL